MKDDAFLEFNEISWENIGGLDVGRMKLSEELIQFKNNKTSKVNTIAASDIEAIFWMRLANKPGLKILTKNGHSYRYGGLPEADFERIKNYAEKNWQINLEQKEHSIKGWNYGRCNFTKDRSLEFEVEDKLCFEFPLANVSQCSANKNEAVLEFHQNEDTAVSLTEMRFHIPQDPDGDEDIDHVEEFRAAVMAYAGVESETEQPMAILQQILCTTPRGRYDIKVYPHHLSLHGKTYDYKIQISSISRLFLLPHKDGRHMYFVISVNPPIRQGQTRYNYLVLEFSKDDETELELGLSDEQLTEKYSNRLQREMKGPVYEVVSRIFRVLVDQKITVPGSFVGHSGTPAISCSYKQAAGLLYPLEKGFVYVHKPPMYIRFEEISMVNFARSDVATRSFDFEIQLSGGVQHVFNGVDKEEYTRLYDFVKNKRLSIRDARRLDKPVYKEDQFVDSDDEIDPYKLAMKREGKGKQGDNDSNDSEDEDSDYDIEKDKKKRAKTKDVSSSEPDEEYDTDASKSESSKEDKVKNDKEKPSSNKTKKTKKSPEKKAKKNSDDNEDSTPASVVSESE